MKKKSTAVRTLLRLLRGSWKYFIACVLFGVLLTGCEVVMPQIIRLAVDAMLGAPPSALLLRFPALWALTTAPARAALALGAAGLLGALFRYLANICNAKAGETLVKTARDTLFRHIQRLPWSWHAENATGDIIQRCTSDVETVKRFFQEQFVSVFRTVVLILLSLACMAAMDLRLALVPLVLSPVIVGYSLLFYRRVAQRFALCDENEGVLSTIAQENLTGVRVVRAFGREAFERERFERQNQLYTGLWVRLCRTLGYFWATGDITSGLLVMLVVVFGTALCVRGEMSAGAFIAFATYTTMLVDPVRRLGRMVSEMSKAGVSVRRIGEILDAPEEQDAPDAAEAPMDGDIAFENVSFRYGDGPPVLEDVSFVVPAGRSFGILGGTGSGKSSLLLLLCRLCAPTAGRITVGGRDIAHMPARWVRRNVGAVLQEPFLFSRSVAENIGICGADEDAIRTAARVACIDREIEGFARGYDTLVGERGVSLSGGQKQRVAIARTLTENAPILVFDDSLSAVDTETDERIRMGLARETKGVTNIIISHRITTLMDCDAVLVLDRGRVAQLGSPGELRQREGIFRRICALQAALGEEEEA